MPDLVVGETPGSSETVSEARLEWQTAGFRPNNFTPQNGLEQQDCAVTGHDHRAVLPDRVGHGHGDPLMSRRRSRTRGQGLVEFALVLPVFTGLAFG